MNGVDHYMQDFSRLSGIVIRTVRPMNLNLRQHKKSERKPARRRNDCLFPNSLNYMDRGDLTCRGLSVHRQQSAWLIGK